jgi:hypothetical protein
MIKLTCPPNDTTGLYSVVLPNPLLEENHECAAQILLQRTRDYTYRTFVKGGHVQQNAFITSLTFDYIPEDLYLAAEKFFTADTVGNYFRYSYFDSERQAQPVGERLIRNGHYISRPDGTQPEADWMCVYQDETFDGEVVGHNCGKDLYRFNVILKRWSLAYPMVKDGGNYRERDEQMHLPPRGPIL